MNAPSSHRLPPLIVDMDGTLILGDTSWASVAESFRHDPLHAGLASLAYVGGRAHGKRAFANIARPKVDHLKYRAPLLAFLEKERSRGRTLHIASGADQTIVDDVAAHLGIFDSARGSDGQINLRGATKLAWLSARFPDGFDYVGDSAADLPIWRAVKRALLVGGAIKYAARLREDGVTILATI